jgi:hypothetical protein
MLIPFLFVVKEQGCQDFNSQIFMEYKHITFYLIHYTKIYYTDFGLVVKFFKNFWQNLSFKQDISLKNKGFMLQVRSIKR